MNNFPVYPTRFIGRSEEVAEIKNLLDINRIISLVGAGGCGKTRLAVEVLGQLVQKFNDGVWFIDLSPIANGELVVKEIMNTLHIPEVVGEDILDTLSAKLAQLNLLIVLDNCEHLIEKCSEVTAKLSEAALASRILVTSRKALSLDGEIVFRVSPLSLVNPDKVDQVKEAEKSEAVLLFMNRARLADKRFELVNSNSQHIARICYKLDGIPLAIELVASRIRYMDPKTMFERLNTRFTMLEAGDPFISARHKTVNSTIEWSYNLLLEEQKELFKRLSVFSGGFDLDAAEAVCADQSLPEHYIIDLLSTLVDCSMVSTTRKPGKPLRYFMLETIRDYASSLNTVSEFNRLRRKHLSYYYDMARVACDERMIRQVIWMEKLGLEFDNYMACLAWAEKNNKSKYRSLAGLLAWFWTRSGYNKLAEKILGSILDEGKVGSSTKAYILFGYSWAISGYIDRFGELFAYGKTAVNIWRRLGNKREEAIAEADLSILYSALNENLQALDIARRATSLAREISDPGALMYALRSLSQALVNLKRCDEAQTVITELLELANRLDNNYMRFSAYHNAGDCAAIQGHFKLARDEYIQGLRCCARSGDFNYTLTELLGVAIAESGMGNYLKALKLTGAANEAAKRAGIISREKLLMEFWHELIHQHIDGARETLGADLQVKCEEEGAAMSLEEAIAYAME